MKVSWNQGIKQASLSLKTRDRTTFLLRETESLASFGLENTSKLVLQNNQRRELTPFFQNLIRKCSRHQKLNQILPLVELYKLAPIRLRS